MDFFRISSGVRVTPVKSALLVPLTRIKWTHPMRKNMGIKATAANLSSEKSLSVRMKRPAIRSRIMRAQKMVAHQQTSSEGLSCEKSRSAGGSE